MPDYPDKFDPTPEKIYSCKMVGGKIKDKEERYPKPRIGKWDKVDDEGKEYQSWNTTIFAKEVVYIEGQPETDDKTLKEYSFWIPERIREQIDSWFNEGIYKFYLRKTSRWYKDKKGIDRSASLWQVSLGLRWFKEFDLAKLEGKTITEPIAKLQPKPETEPEVPFDDDMGDDEIAFKEDIKPKLKPEQEFITPEPTLIQILVTLQNIEEDLRIIANCFKEMLDKFTVKLKKVRE